MRPTTAIGLTALVLAACSGNPGPVADAAPVDAAAVDAAVDAGGMCPGELVFTGGYEDWDSTLATFDGVEFATATHVEDPQRTAQTAPNGRLVMCLPAAQTAHVDFAQPDYLDLRYTMSPVAQMVGPFDIRGLKPLRAQELYALELGLSLDPQAAHVLVAMRTYPTGAPAYGAFASLGNAHAGAFTDDGTGRYVAGDQLDFGAFVLFANVEVGAGSTSVTVSPPSGLLCLGPQEIALVPGALAATTFACVPP